MKKFYILFLLLSILTSNIFAQDIEQNVEKRLNDFFSQYATTNATIGKCSLKEINLDHNKRKLSVMAS